MQPRERRETGEQDLFRSRLDQIIDLKHPLAALGRTVDWGFLEREFGAVYTDDPGRPPLPTRLMAGLAILKHTYDLSDEVLCERWVENPYYQYFCGEEFFQHRLVFDRSSLTRWRNRMGEERLQALLQESLSVATRTKAIKPSELSRVIVDTTVQPKNVTFPTDAKLLNRAREKLVRLAQRHGVALRQSYTRVGKFALIQHQRYAHAKQFKRANRMLKKLRTYLGRVIRDIGRKIEGDSGREGTSHSCYCWRGACASRSNISAAGRSIPCMRRKSNASAKARLIGLTSSASKSPSQPRSVMPRAASSSPM
jgi:IS5 family transposase